jgi:hypothetical protein
MDEIAIRAPLCGELPFQAGANPVPEKERQERRVQFYAGQGAAGAAARAQEQRRSSVPKKELQERRHERKSSGVISAPCFVLDKERKSDGTV